MSGSNCPSKIDRDEQSVFGKIWARLISFFAYLKRSYKTIILIVIVAVVSVASTTLISMLLSSSDYDVYVPGLGTIKTIEVEIYWDPNGETKRETISWGELEPGASLDTLVYVKSVSNFVVTLNLNLTDWNPEEISDYLTISWDYDGTLISPNEIIPVTMTLSASSSDAFIDYLIDNEIKNFEVAIHFIASD